MAIKRNCENKSYLLAKGSMLRFVGAANDKACDKLMRAFDFALHVEKKGNDVVAYYDDDFYLDDLRFINQNYSFELGHFLKPGKCLKKKDIILATVLPEHLNRQGGKTWEEVYNMTLESTTRDEDGMSFGSSRETGLNYDSEKIPAIVKVYSANEFRVNGHF